MQDYSVVVRSLAAGSPENRYAGFKFHLATSDDIPEIMKQLKDVYKDEGSLRNLFDQGDKAVIGASTNSDIVFISWLSYKDKLFLTFMGDGRSATDIYHKRMWIPVAYRGRGLAKIGVGYAEKMCIEMGAEKIWGITEIDNNVSFNLHMKLGYTDYGKLRIGSCLGYRYAVFRNAGQKKWQSLSTRYL